MEKKKEGKTGFSTRYDKIFRSMAICNLQTELNIPPFIEQMMEDDTEYDEEECPPSMVSYFGG